MVNIISLLYVFALSLLIIADETIRMEWNAAFQPLFKRLQSLVSYINFIFIFFLQFCHLLTSSLNLIRKQAKSTAVQACGCGDNYQQWDKILFTLQKHMAKL